MSSGKTKTRKNRRNKQPQARKTKITKQAAPENPAWDEIAKYPMVLYITLGRGVIIGFLGGGSDTLVRIYAPACVQEAPPSNVIFLPLFPVEHFMDLSRSCIFSTSPVPVILAKGYLGYYEQFAKGNYRMQPVVINAGIDTPEGAHKVSGVPEVEQPEAMEELTEGPPPAETASVEETLKKVLAGDMVTVS